jgi:peptide deformylase
MDHSAEKKAAEAAGDDQKAKIIVYGHPTLRVIAPQVENIDGEIAKLVEILFATMRRAPGIGLAAPQIDRSTRVIVVDPTATDETTRPLALINPRIREYAGSATFEEGCLSVPGIFAELARPAHILARYYDIAGKEHEEEFDGIMARVIQHETDHLDGKLFVDHLSAMRRALLGKRLREIASRS